MNARKIKKNVLRLDNSDRERGGGQSMKLGLLTAWAGRHFFVI